MPITADRPVLSTYRLQLRGDAFTFADAEQIVDYLGDLGVSHLYLSPILTAEPGSAHGYDVTDPTSVSAQIGGAAGLTALARAAHRRGLGLIVDIVPNHAGVGLPSTIRGGGMSWVRPDLALRELLRYRLERRRTRTDRASGAGLRHRRPHSRR